MRGVVARRVVGRRRSVSRSSSVVSLGVVEAYHGRIRTQQLAVTQRSVAAKEWPPLRLLHLALST